jgi:hypothetical protein
MNATTWLDSIFADLFAHGFAIVAQTNQQKSCPLCGRYVSKAAIR